MESDDSEVCKLQVRKVVQEVQKFVWFKQEVIHQVAEPQIFFVPEISAEFLKNLRVSVWIVSACNDYVWEDFMKNHFNRMVKSPYLFANYVAYASYLMIENNLNVHMCFLNVLSLMVHFTLYCWGNKHKGFVTTCVDLFCAFFDKELCASFEGQERWKKLDKYLEKQDGLKRYKELINANQSPYEIFKEFAARHSESGDPYIINGVVLKDITQSQVENDKKAVSFAETVADKLKETYAKEVAVVLAAFRDTDQKLEELYRKTIVEAAEGMASDENRSSLQKVQETPLETVHCTPPKPTKSKNKKTKSPCVSGPSNKDSLESPKPSSKSPKPSPSPEFNIARAKALLNKMMEDAAKISELIKFVCSDYEDEVPTEGGNAGDKQ